MDPVTPFEWSRIFIGNQPPLYFLEIVVRVVVIFAGAFVIMLMLSKRSRKQSNTFDTLIVIALGSAVGDVMFYPTVPILYAFSVIIGVVLLNRLLASLDVWSESFHKLVAGTPTLLVRDGQVLMDELRKEKMVINELFSLLREQGVANTGEVRLGFLEPSGGLGLFKFDKGEEVAGQSTLPDSFTRCVP